MDGACRTELFTYEACIFFTVVTALITLPRQELKAKVVDAPEILTIISTIPHLESFLNSFYSCRYADFLQVLPRSSPAATVWGPPHAVYSSSPLCLLLFTHRMQASVCGMQSRFVPCSGPCNPQTTHCQQLRFFDLPACCMLALWHVASICCAWAQPAPSPLYLHQHVSDSLSWAMPQPASILA